MTRNLRDIPPLHDHTDHSPGPALQRRSSGGLHRELPRRDRIRLGRCGLLLVPAHVAPRIP
ncbi:hypothetical protein M407DRAFT_131424 [Tulasnella calospora MUT 4182]|uniref:Uncharacterized protein n=1 Tax=Tulasnella calospora MUT 4182 TaxID=1051891 RepID=A0A0C3QHX7_9AGAM|nr:hypothetical protein M407DRAFT_131424 [Tulasnella calospora MUT 4182]